MYTVYALIDPRDSLIRYVGITTDVYRRFKEHIAGEGKNSAKDAWVEDLQREQVMMIMSNLATAETLIEALKLEADWIAKFLEQGLPLFNISTVEFPSAKQTVKEMLIADKLLVYDGKPVRYSASEIDEILDWYLLTGQLPQSVSERTRYHYRHHPRLEDRRRLLEAQEASV